MKDNHTWYICLKGTILLKEKKDFDAICIIYVIFSKVAYGNHVMAYNTFKQIADLDLI